MEDGSIMLHIAAIIGLLIVNIIFYGFGAALQELNETLLEKNGQEGDRKAMRLYQLNFTWCIFAADDSKQACLYCMSDVPVSFSWCFGTKKTGCLALRKMGIYTC